MSYISIKKSQDHSYASEVYCLHSMFHPITYMLYYDVLHLQPDTLHGHCDILTQYCVPMIRHCSITSVNLVLIMKVHNAATVDIPLRSYNIMQPWIHQTISFKTFLCRCAPIIHPRANDQINWNITAFHTADLRCIALHRESPVFKTWWM